MRAPSRRMPPRAFTPIGVLVGLIAVAVLGGAWLIYASPRFGLACAAVLVVYLVLGIIVNRAEKRRVVEIAAARRGESICNFARSFDCRTVDTWVIRAVYEELRGFAGFPIRTSDLLNADLSIEGEDLDDMAADAAHRAGRSMQNVSLNPMFQKVRTAGDLVMFLVHQPRMVEPR